MKSSKPLFSIIIPVRVETDYLRETVEHLKKQTFKSFELLVITDKISQTSNPAQKRNLGAKMAQGEYLAFLDDDSYPHQNWLKNALTQFKKHPEAAAVCGPCLTPPQDNVFQQASGLVWASYLGSGGAGTYRNSVASARYVDDYPTVNLIARKTDFDAVGGFNTHHWPGEDTILCLDFVYKLKRKIYYHPSIRVCHHRRNVVIPHLKQITRYALHRGNFARIFPKTSFKIGYFVPTFFLAYIIALIPLFYIFHQSYLFFPLYLYLFLLVITFIISYHNSKRLLASLLAIVSIPLTHLYYGYLFIVGFFTPNLDFVPHQVDVKNNKYLGG